MATADDAEKVRAIIDEMSKANAPIFTKLYQAAQEQANANAGAAGSANGEVNPDDIIIDGDDNK